MVHIDVSFDLIYRRNIYIVLYLYELLPIEIITDLTIELVLTLDYRRAQILYGCG